MTIIKLTACGMAEAMPSPNGRDAVLPSLKGLGSIFLPTRVLGEAIVLTPAARAGVSARFFPTAYAAGYDITRASRTKLAPIAGSLTNRDRDLLSPRSGQKNVAHGVSRGTDGGRSQPAKRA